MQGPDPLAVAGLVISALSLLIAGAVAYLEEFRGSGMKVDVLRAPEVWQAQIGRPAAGKPPGIWHLADADSNFWMMVSGKSPGRVLNTGPKGGGIWDIAVDLHPLGTDWSMGSSVDITDPFTLDGKRTQGFHLTVVLRCPRDQLASGLAWLENAGQPLRLRLSYSRFAAFGRKVTHHSDVWINAHELSASIRAWAKESNFPLPDATPTAPDTGA